MYFNKVFIEKQKNVAFFAKPQLHEYFLKKTNSDEEIVISLVSFVVLGCLEGLSSK